jgi:hypothetical protein
MSLDDEIHSLSAFEMAMQSLFAELCIGLIAKDQSNSYLISKVFDHAANHVEDVAIRAGKSASPKHTAKALRIVEELRTVVLGNVTKQKDSV